MSRYQDYVCIVTGASRGIGRGIALGLGQLGATVYITGRTLNSSDAGKIGGSLEETAEEIRAKGGKAIPVAVDHSDDKQVKEFFDRVQREQQGRLDVLVNNAYAAVQFLTREAGKTYYEIDSCSPAEAWDRVNNVGLRNNYICATYATRLMLRFREEKADITNPGLIINVSSLGGRRYLFNTAYGVGKAGVDRMASDMGVELRRRKANVCAISLWPGAVRTEELVAASKDGFTGIPMDEDLTESTELSGLAIAALVKESPKKLHSRSGQIVTVSDVVREHGICEPDGSIPTDIRSVSTLLRLSGYSLGNYIPGFIRVPNMLFMYFISQG